MNDVPEPWSKEMVARQFSWGSLICRLRISGSNGIAIADVYSDYDFCTKLHKDLEIIGWVWAGSHIDLPENVIGSFYFHADTTEWNLSATRKVIKAAVERWPDSNYVGPHPRRREHCPRWLWPKFEFEFVADAG